MSELLKNLPSPHSRLIALWLLRIFSPPLGRSCLVQGGVCKDDDIAGFLGIQAAGKGAPACSVEERMDALKTAIEKAGDAILPPDLMENMNRFGEVLGMGPDEILITAFFACRETEPCLDDGLRLVQHLLASDPVRFLSNVLVLDHEVVARAVRKGGTLVRAGVLKWSDRFSKQPILRFFSPEVAGHLVREPYDHARILSSMGVAPCGAPDLGLGDYPHISGDLAILVPYLKRACATGRTGVNILIHGEPGTGKTQLTRVLAEAAGVRLFDLAAADDDGDPLCGMGRLQSIRIAGAFFRDQAAMFVFDELEDLITPVLRERGAAGARKGWFNRQLESNIRPVFWLTNTIEHLDPAFVRRFDFVIDLPVPPRSQLAGILRREAGGMLTPQAIERFSRIEHLSPAVINRASGIVATACEGLPAEQMEEAFSRIIGGVLKAQGHPDPRIHAADSIPAGVYDVSRVNASADLSAITESLKAHPSVRICLHGPPGTGKTAFGHWLAGEIGRPLHVKRASDLLDAFVGHTERNIAKAFERAAGEGAVLMIDEADSFLMDRSNSQRSWEVTLVNEMLTRIESFGGVLVASTNRLEHMDPASLRRFDLKIRMDYLLPAQAFELLDVWCRGLAIAPPSARHARTVESLDRLTPGDFHAVARRHRFQPYADADAFLAGLEEECLMNTGGSRLIGFH